jgi:hypothetical protein
MGSGYFMRKIRAVFFAVLIMFLVIPSFGVEAGNGTSIDIPLEVLNNDQSLRLEGLTGTQNIEFVLPKNWKITDQSWLTLSATASELLAAPDSSITISVNGLQLSSLSLKDLLGADRRIPLPPNFLVAGSNVLTFDGMLYLPDDLLTNCKGWDDPSRWMYFNPQSSLHVGFEKQSLPADLSNFPDSFLQPLDRYIPDGGDKTLFVLPDNIKPDDMNALSATAYFLGRQGGDAFPWNPQIVTQTDFDHLTIIHQNVIFVNHIPPQFDDVIATEKNAIGIFSSPWDSSKTVMVIFDKDREDGYTPTLIFGDWIKKVLLSGNVAYFDKTAEKAPLPFKKKYTLEELGYLDRTVRGIGIADLVYKVYLPYHIDPTSANLALQISHSPGLDDKTSSISVNLNGFTVASILPATKNSRLEPIRVDLPTKRFRAGINYIRVSFDLHIPYSSCEKAPETVWATIFNSSTLQMTYRNRTTLPTLKDFPAPFNEDPGVTFVIPDTVNTSILEKISHLTFAFGASSLYTNHPPKVLTAGQFTQAKGNDENYFLIGLPLENAAIQNINEYLPQPFKTGSNQLQEGYGVFLPNAASDASLGLVQITPSPWKRDGIILVLSGTSSKGLDWAWNSILKRDVRTRFSGNIMIVGPKDETSSASGDASTIYFEQTPMVVNIPLIGKFLQQNGQSEQIISLMAIALAGLFTLIMLKVAPVILNFDLRKWRRQSSHSEKEKE